MPIIHKAAYKDIQREVIGDNRAANRHADKGLNVFQRAFGKQLEGARTRSHILTNLNSQGSADENIRNIKIYNQ